MLLGKESMHAEYSMCTGEDTCSLHPVLENGMQRML